MNNSNTAAMSTINGKTIEQLMAPTRMSLDWLEKVTWNLQPAGHFSTRWYGGNWMLSILKGGSTYSNRDTFEVAICHKESGDILSVRGYQTAEDIIQLTSDIVNQSL